EAYARKGWRSGSGRGGGGRCLMSSRVFDSMEIDCDGRLSSKRRLGCGGSWAPAGAAKAAPMNSTAIPVANLTASTRLPYPGRVYRRRARAVTYSRGTPAKLMVGSMEQHEA